MTEHTRVCARRLLTHVNFNMRELGGYPAADGAYTRYGRFIRSDEPVSLSGGDIQFLLDYGVKTAIDMRVGFETDMTHSLKNVPGVDYINIPFSTDMEILYAESFDPEIHYVPLLTDTNGLKDIFTAMAGAGPGGIIFNCLAGKDRTGMVSAMLLLIAGVPADDVIADYYATYIYMNNNKDNYIRQKYAWHYGVSPAVCFPFLSFIKSRGGAEQYLLNLGVGERDIAALKRRLTGDY